MNRKVLFILALMFLCFACANSQKNKNATAKKHIIKTIDQLVVKNNIPGLNVSIIHADGRQENFSSGYANAEDKTPLNENHVMFSGSIGKTYAVAILMQMVEEGKLKLNDRIIDFFPELDWLNRLPNIDQITVKMLLQHTSGLPRYVFKEGVWDSLRHHPDKVWTYEDRLFFIFDDEPIHEAGKGWGYSDSNYILLGMLIEKLTGNYYYDEVETRLLIPYDLKETYPAVKRDIINLPMAYSKLSEEFHMPHKVVVDGQYIFNPQMEWTGGGLASTTPNLAKWAALYYSGRLFSDSTRHKIITPNDQGIEIDEGLSYGMGSFIYSTPHGKAYGHTGFVPGFVSIFAYYPDHKIAIALQVNCDYAAENMPLIAYLNKIIEALLTKD